MKSFDDLKKYAISDILSASGKDKITRVAENHINNLIEVALIKGAQSRQAEIDELRAYITKAQGCLPYYLLDIKSKDNWIGGVQSYIVELEVKIEESILKLEAINSSIWEESIEDVLSILKENPS